MQVSTGNQLADELTEIKIIFEDKYIRLRIPATSSVGQVLKAIRKHFQISIFYSLEVRLNGKPIQAKKPILRLEVLREPRIEIIKRRWFDCF